MARKNPNILLIAIDSLRRDHMSCYGYPKLTTPFMDKLVEKGTLFENAFSPYVPTTPAYVSMLTGRDVISTQMPSLRPKHPMLEDQPTFPEILKKAGYTSVCVGHNEWYRGFDQYLAFESWGSSPDGKCHKAEALNDVTLPVLDDLAGKEEPWFVFLRHMDPHTPYLPPAPYDKIFYSKDPCDKSLPNTMQAVWDFKPFAEYFQSWTPEGLRDADWVIAQYDGAIAYMDACIQRIFTRLEELGIMEDTLIVINSDHGETLYDHECWFDHHGIYECTLVVPLIFHWPGKVPANTRTQAYTLHEDLLPTVLDICGLKSAAKGVKFDGVSLKPYLTDTINTPRSEFYIEECTWMRKHGWRTPIWKYWEALEPDFHNKPQVELYNIVEDPEELVNLADKEPQIVELLRERMLAWEADREKAVGMRNAIHGYELGLDLKIGSVAKAKALQEKKKK